MVVEEAGSAVGEGLGSFDSKKAAGKDKCSAESFLGRGLSRLNRECAGIGSPGVFEVPAIWNILSTAKTTKGVTCAISTLTTEGTMNGKVSNITLPQNVALRPSMSELCMLLGAYFVDSLKYGRNGCKASTSYGGRESVWCYMVDRIGMWKKCGEFSLT